MNFIGNAFTETVDPMNRSVKKRKHIKKRLHLIKTNIQIREIQSKRPEKKGFHHSTDDSENEEKKRRILERLNKSKKLRRSKKDNSNRNFICDKCNLTYLSYPALYTHKRNKHNIIPITKKPEVFKNIERVNPNGKKFRYFKYTEFNENTNLHKLCINIIDIMRNVLEDLYSNTKSQLYIEGFIIENYPLISLLISAKNNKTKHISIPKRQENYSIDRILTIYLLLLIEVSVDSTFIKNVIKFVVLLREHLNLCGWEHKKYLFDYGMSEAFVPVGDFCDKNNTEEVPELLNDFIEVFIDLDPDNHFGIDKSSVADLTENFSNWMFLNELTNFKIFSLNKK